MERYELANGKVYDIILWSDEHAVVSDNSIVYSGTYADCRRYIERQK